MALVASRVMSTTTCLQLDELQDKLSTFHCYILSETVSGNKSTTLTGKQSSASKIVEAKQNVLLLKGARRQYTLVNDHTIPSILHPRGILVKV